MRRSSLSLVLLQINLERQQGFKLTEPAFGFKHPGSEPIAFILVKDLYSDVKVTVRPLCSARPTSENP